MVLHLAMLPRCLLMIINWLVKSESLHRFIQIDNGHKREMVVNKTVLIEGILICAMGASSIVEGFRLINMEKIQLFDVLGPGNYNLGLGVFLIILGLIYLISHRRKGPREGKIVERGMRIKMISMIIILAVYSFLINITGYLLASIVFFILIFRAVGFKSWLFIMGLSIGISLSLYIIFVRWLSMVFPRGILFP